MKKIQASAKRSAVALFLIINLIFSFSLCINAEQRILSVGGMPFGVKINCEGVTISGFTDTSIIPRKDNPALKAGLKAGDVIKEINGMAVSTPDDVVTLTTSSNGNKMTIKYRRDNSEHSTTVKPKKTSEGEYKLGITLKDTVAGIGTITFIGGDGTFGGLGHGICDPFTGAVIGMSKGIICDVDITDVIKGESGKAGELHGIFKSERIGAVLKNCDKGIFGVFTKEPKSDTFSLPCAEPEDITVGDATIYTTLDNNGIKPYSIKIESIDLSTQTKNFVIKITDNDLIQKTGGIIQGMSGSPIVQNGKIVGAVTHVMISDPTKGYGIYIENMLNEIKIR